MSLEQLIGAYGYAAIAAGSFLEGETVLLLGGFAAHRGYLSLSWVMVWAGVGSFLGDQFYFYLGRLKGTRILEKRPYWQSKSVRVFELIQTHQLGLILGFRFLYGLRTVAPILLGTSGIPPMRFLVLNLISAVIWAVVVGGAGYVFGNVLTLMLDDIKRYEHWVFLALALFGAAAWLAYWWWSRRRFLDRNA